MSRLLPVLVLIVVLLLVYVKGKQCSLGDQECITLAMKKLYPVVVAGDASLGVESSDPLKKDKIIGVTPTLNYTLTNNRFYGFSNCDVREARSNIVDEHGLWHMFLDCPMLTIQMDYWMEGYVASERVRGEGEAEIKFWKYEISFNGDLEKEYRGEDLYIRLTKFVLTRLEVIDKAVFMFNDLYLGDPERKQDANEFINHRWQEFNSQAQQPAMRELMEELINNFKKYFDKVPVSEMFTY